MIRKIKEKMSNLSEIEHGIVYEKRKDHKTTNG